MKKLITILVVLVVASSASAVSTDLELVLLCDVSGSMDTPDFELVRDGYEAAFRDADIINRIQTAGPEQNIAVTLVYWSTGQAVAVDWTLISDSTTSNAFADAIAAAPRPGTIGVRTDMSGAMNMADDLFSTNSYDAPRQVLDISADGYDNEPGSNATEAANVAAARDAALALGIDSINALLVDDGAWGTGLYAPATYANTYMVGGTDPIVDVVTAFADFEAAVLAKIGEEIDPGPVIPAPGAILLGGIGVGLVGWLRRRRAL